MVYEVNFKRLASEQSMDVVLRRPYSDELEDYREYKRLRNLAREKQEKGSTSPLLTFSSDGAGEGVEKEKIEEEGRDSSTEDVLIEEIKMIYHV